MPRTNYQFQNLKSIFTTELIKKSLTVRNLENYPKILKLINIFLNNHGVKKTQNYHMKISWSEWKLKISKFVRCSYCIA